MVTSSVPPPALASYAHNLGNINKIETKIAISTHNDNETNSIKTFLPTYWWSDELRAFCFIETSHFFSVWIYKHERTSNQFIDSICFNN
jgi:hypothetical protein